MENNKLTQQDLKQFTGDLERFRHSFNRQILYTPGVRFLAERAGAYWLIDAIASYFGTNRMARALESDLRLACLQFWRLDEAIRTGQSYQSRLNPPPGPPVDASGNFIPMSQWDMNNWPSHIHPPREAVESIDWTLAAEAVDEELMADVSYPATQRDQLLCAAALSIVEQAGPLSSMDHLDALALVAHPAWCKAFLHQSSQVSLGAALAGVSELVATPEQPINWKQCRDYLELRKAISIEHAVTSQPISAASGMSAVKQTLPAGIEEAVGFALKALQRMAEVREDIANADSTQRQIIDSFGKQHRELQLVA